MGSALPFRVWGAAALCRVPWAAKRCAGSPAGFERLRRDVGAVCASGTILVTNMLNLACGFDSQPPGSADDPIGWTFSPAEARGSPGVLAWAAENRYFGSTAQNSKSSSKTNNTK